MSNIDLTEAVEAAARGWFEDAPFAPPWDVLADGVKHRAHETMLPGVAAAAPVVEAAVRAQIASEIELRAYGPGGSVVDAHSAGVREGLLLAATIARGDS